MSSSKGLLRHLAQQQRLWSCCSPLSVITRQTSASAASASQGIFNGIGFGFARGLTSLVNGVQPLNNRRDNGRPMPIGIRRYVTPVVARSCSKGRVELHLSAAVQIDCPSHHQMLGRWILDPAHTPPTAGSFCLQPCPQSCIITLLSNFNLSYPPFSLLIFQFCSFHPIIFHPLYTHCFLDNSLSQKLDLLCLLLS
jgi:hypothetical protein